MTPDELEPLSADLQALLDAERPVTAAPAGAKAKLLARLSTELFDGPGGDGSGGEGADGGGGSAPSGGGGAAPATPTGAGSLGASAGTATVGATGSGVVAKAVVAKLVVGASVTSLAVGGAIGAGVHSAVTTPPPPPPIVRQVERPAVAAPVDLPPPPPPLVDVAPTPPPAPRPGPPKLSADEQLALERSYVEQARAAMARRDVDAAMEALSQHERRFPNGQLTEERLALKVMALASAGRSIEAKNVAVEFRRRFPAGLFRAAVDDASPE